jgi:hypothetical protein
LHARGAAIGVEVRDLLPVLADLNADLARLGAAALLRHLAPQLGPADRMRSIAPDAAAEPYGAT